MATNSSVKKIITIEVQGNQAKASIDGVTMSTKELNKELKTLSQVGGKASAGGATGATGGATATVLELGRTISDANYGIRGMANNLSQLVSNLVFTTRAAGGLAAGIKSIWTAMMGPLGLVLAGQAVIALLERFSMQADKTKDSVDALEKEVKELNKTLKDEIKILHLYEEALMDSNTTLEERLGIVKGLSVIDKDLAKQLKKANGDRKKETKILKDLIFQKELELKIAEKKAQIEDVLARIQEIKNNDTFTEEQRKKLEAMQQRDLNRLFSEYLLLLKDINIEEEQRSGRAKKTKTQKKQDPVTIGEDLFGLIIPLDAAERRRFLDSISSLGEEAAIRASEGNIMLLESEIKNQERIVNATKSGTIERFEAEQLLTSMKLDLMDREFEHEMMLLDLRMQAQLEYVDFVSGIGQVFSTLGKESEELAKVGLIIEKGAAVAGVVIETQKANAQILSASATEVGFYKAAAAVTALNPVASEFYAAKAAQAQVGAAKRVTKNNVGAAIAIANILATTLTSKSLSGGGGRAGGGEGGGGRTFDFNLVGSTGTNQLAEAVGGQFQQPVQAYVVSSEMTSQQELDLQIEAGASVGD